MANWEKLNEFEDLNMGIWLDFEKQELDFGFRHAMLENLTDSAEQSD